MYRKNLPVPPAPRAPVNVRWLWWIGPPALITVLYRCIPPSVRRIWAKPTNSTSHYALAQILAGGGWRVFILSALPLGRMMPGGHPSFPGSWLPFGNSDRVQMSTWIDPRPPYIPGNRTDFKAPAWYEAAARGDYPTGSWLDAVSLDMAWHNVDPRGGELNGPWQLPSISAGSNAPWPLIPA